MISSSEEAPTPFYSYQVTGCGRAGFTFARSAGARGDQNAVSPDDIILYRNIEIYIYIYICI